MNSPFTPRFTNALLYARDESKRRNMHGYILPEHILWALVHQPDGPCIDLLSELEIDLETLQGLTDELLEVIYTEEIADAIPKEAAEVPEDALMLNLDSSQLINKARVIAKRLEQPLADVDTVFVACTQISDTPMAEALSQFNEQLNYENLMEYLEKKYQVYNGISTPDDDEEELDNWKSGNANGDSESKPDSQSGGSGKRRPPRGNESLELLGKFGVDITAQARQDLLDPVVGREKEIERVAQILSRRKKNNPVLVGEAGVGKTAIIEGLAKRIVDRKVSRLLFDKRLFSLDLPGMVAGTKYRGQFEERLRGVIKELEEHPDIVLFIDELHTIVGAGSAPGTMDAANILKPALARGVIQCIGATTNDEYRQSIEKDKALERRFQKVNILAPDAVETLEILQQLKGRYEEHHGVSYTEGALKACVDMTDRYISSRSWPDKAIDAMDEAGSRVHMLNINVPETVTTLEQEVAEMNAAKREAVMKQNFEMASTYREKEVAAKERLDAAKQEWLEQQSESRIVVDIEQIAEVVSMMSGIPVQRMAQNEGIRLKNLKTTLQHTVIGQDSAIEKLSKAIMRNRVGLKPANRPIGTFLFMGPTGVGKTHLSKQLAKEMFGTEEALIRIDMSEYMEKHTVSRLVGSPPGYVGFEEGGQLTEQVRRRPYSILLFDELEKAHSDVFNILLQLLDEGRLTDNQGVTVDFRNTVIIMTSNIGSRQAKDFGRGVGFASIAGGDSQTERDRIIMKALNKFFAPEFLNRIDEIVSFDALDKDAIHKILGLELADLKKRLNRVGFKIQLSDAARNFLVDKGFDTQYGARPLKRSIQTYLEDGLAEILVDQPAESTGSISVDYKEGDEKLSFKVELDTQTEFADSSKEVERIIVPAPDLEESNKK